ncbi:MAG: HAMP domain-containing histidine kinase, partial [Muribaculaceae bacterium]|nr:HAMP domain-containing histidine kinase [Muribaculaceae bacterium]
VKMREEQFSETVMRCLSSTSSYLERKETLHFLEEDVNIIESSLLEDNSFSSSNPKVPSQEATKIGNNQQVGNLEKRYRDMQEVIRSQYLYQKGLLNEVILSILRESGARPAIERADSTVIRNYLTAELESNGLNVPFEFAVTTNKNAIIYASEGFDENLDRGVYSQVLFPNTDNQYRLQVEFPTKRTYIFSSVRFIIPTLAFTLILLIIFLYTIFLAFRQKKLSEMKTDFINNMTHELKTPISTISLAAQMLNDDSIMKSPTSLKHLSQVITDESKRVRFQVEKVLQMSVFDNSGSALKFSDVDANKVVENVTHTFKIKVEKYGGSISCKTEAENAIVNVDEMHFTNIIYNLLDNAVKYMREDTEPKLSIITRDIDSRHLEIRVSDNGIGIKKEDLKKIFDKFYRVSTGNRHDVKGFGLGLAYVKKMVTIFEGTISAESELGKGSTFVIVLPLAQPK